MMEAKDFEGEYLIHKLSPNEIVRTFDCSDKDLNDFIMKDALSYRRSLLAVTYVLSSKDEPKKVLAFCSLAHDTVSLADFDSKNEFNRFRRKRGIHYSKKMSNYPAIKVCRLGVDRSVQNRRLGTILLNYVKSSFSVEPKAGCRFVTVDAYFNAIPFYEKNGFCKLKNKIKDSEQTQSLYFDLGDIVHSDGK